MKKKETLWQLLKRLDEEAGQFSVHLHEANRYFDTASTKTQKILKTHEKHVHQIADGIRKIMGSMMKKKKSEKK